MTKPARLPRARTAPAPRAATPSRPAPAPRSAPPAPLLHRAEVLSVEDDDTVLVRLHAAPTEEVRRAELAVPVYTPAPGDRVLCQQGTDAWFVVGALGPARRRAVHLAGGTLTLTAPCVHIRATSEIAVSAEAVRTTAPLIADAAGRRETVAERIVERASDAYRHTSGLTETTAGRARTFVKDLYSVFTRRTTLESTEETAIDGKRVLLG